MSPPPQQTLPRTKMETITDFRTLFTDLPMGMDAKADLIEFIVGHAKNAKMSNEDYVIGGLLVEEAQQVLNNHAEGFSFTMEDVFMLSGT